MVSRKMKEIAEAYLDSTMKNALVIDPACFSDPGVRQRLLTNDTHLDGEGFGNRMWSTILSRNSTENTKSIMVFNGNSISQPLILIFSGKSQANIISELLKKFYLSWIPPAPRRVPRPTLCFDIEVNGILNVPAVDKYHNYQ
ncbi:unnamed protein product [Musa acuminata subsp. malaccensis]|uniref:(wild Malaysian banana) hypothetical protein n=1 Tax=Musa acuminata subsp. malaccensis TaxID=214687 RepID=A0A804JAH9_MUSAM|nr:unnamed protein product [Musa acuminata subsp. malaccensis]